MKMENIEKILATLKRQSEFCEWNALQAADAELAVFKEIEKKAIRLCETIWHRQWSNPEDCLVDAIDLMKVINPDHPMAKVRTLRETVAAKKDSYIALRKANERLREGLNLVTGQVVHIGGGEFRLGEAYGIKRCAEIAESYLGGSDD